MAGKPAEGARGLGCDIRPPQGLETWVVTSAPAGASKLGCDIRPPQELEDIGFDVVRGRGLFTSFPGAM